MLRIAGRLLLRRSIAVCAGKSVGHIDPSPLGAGIWRRKDEIPGTAAAMIDQAPEITKFASYIWMDPFTGQGILLPGPGGCESESEIEIEASSVKKKRKKKMNKHKHRKLRRRNRLSKKKNK